MQKHFNLQVFIVSIATLILLLSATISEARDVNGGIHNAVYEFEALQYSPSINSKASYSRYNGKKHYSYNSRRNYYRGHRNYRGGNSYYRANRYHRYDKRSYYPRHGYYGKRYNYHYQYGY